MRKANMWLITACVSAVLSLFATSAQAASRLTLESGGLKRTAVIVQRGKLRLASRPIVIVLRRPVNDLSLRRWTEIGESVNHGWPILVLPDPLNHQWGTIGPDAERDAAFVRQLASHLVQNGHADPSKIFLIGVSSGAALGYRLACDGLGNQTLAGYAAMIGAMPVELSSCSPKRRMPFIVVNSLTDNVAPFDGGATHFRNSANFEALPTAKTLEIFAAAAQCGEKKPDQLLPDRDAHDESRAYAVTYKGCSAPVEMIRVEGAGHNLPGTRRDGEIDSSGRRNGDFDAVQYVWDFLRRAAP